MFNKVLVSVSVNCRNVRKCCVWQKPLWLVITVYAVQHPTLFIVLYFSFYALT